jgi:hypothetical protein
MEISNLFDDEQDRYGAGLILEKANQIAKKQGSADVQVKWLGTGGIIDMYVLEIRKGHLSAKETFSLEEIGDYCDGVSTRRTDTKLENLIQELCA